MRAYKNYLKQWFKSKHYITTPAHKDHSAFISCLSYLEGLYEEATGESIRLIETGNIDDNWKELLKVINALCDCMIQDLYRYKINQYTNRM